MACAHSAADWRAKALVTLQPSLAGTDQQRYWELSEKPHTQVFFAATGVSDGDLLRGVRYFSGGASTNSIVMRASSGTGGFPTLPSLLSGHCLLAPC